MKEEQKKRLAKMLKTPGFIAGLVGAAVVIANAHGANIGGPEAKAYVDVIGGLGILWGTVAGY